MPFRSKKLADARFHVWDRPFVGWLGRQGYEIRYDGPGHIHILSGYCTIIRGRERDVSKLYSWELNIYPGSGTLEATAPRGVKHLLLADPDLFEKLEKLFPKVEHNTQLHRVWKFISAGLGSLVRPIIRHKRYFD